MKANALTATGINAAIKKQLAGTVKLVDGQGLRLELKGGSHRWVFAYRWRGKGYEQPLGMWPSVTLAEARILRGVLRDAKDSGFDPRVRYLEHTGKVPVVTALEPQPPPPVITLRTEMHAHMVHREGAVKASSNKQMIQLLERSIPTLMDMDPAQITRADVLAAIKPMWDSKRRSAEKIIAYGRMIWRYSQGHTGKPNPFGERPRDLAVKDGLRPGGDPKVIPRAAMPASELPKFMTLLRQRDEIEARAVELLLLTLCPRTDEILGLRWRDINFGKGEMTTYVKVGTAGRIVPLSEAALDLLRGIRPIGYRPSDWIFPARVDCESGRKGKDAMQVMLRVQMGLSCTVHGFRSTLMDWVAEHHPLLLMAAERALDHRIGGKVMQAYLRTGMTDNRQELARLWTAHLNQSGGLNAA